MTRIYTPIGEPITYRVFDRSGKKSLGDVTLNTRCFRTAFEEVTGWAGEKCWDPNDDPLGYSHQMTWDADGQTLNDEPTYLIRGAKNIDGKWFYHPATQ